MEFKVISICMATIEKPDPDRTCDFAHPESQDSLESVFFSS